MKFGSVDFNEKTDWSKWKFEDFKKLVESHKGITDKPEKIAKALGVPIPEKRPKKDE